MIHKSTFNMFVVLIFIAVTSGCASITGTTNQSISVQTRLQDGKELAGASCELSNNKGKWFVTSPGSITVTRSNDDMKVLCNNQGLEPGRADVVSATKGSMFGNILFGGGIGAIIDHNNGAAYEYPTFIQIMMGVFTKIEAPNTVPDQKAQEGSKTQPALMGNPNIATTQSEIIPLPTVSKEEKLRELKKLSDAGLISPEMFLERQRKILE